MGGLGASGSTIVMRYGLPMMAVLFARIAKFGIVAVSDMVRFIPAVTGIGLVILPNTTSKGKTGVKLAGKTSGMTPSALRVFATVVTFTS